MKYKTIFSLFNVIIVLSFLFIFLMPLFVLGWDYALAFWSESWYLAILFALVLGVLDFYFISHWRLFQLLEQENWPELHSYLGHQIFGKNRLSGQNIILYINASLMKNELEEIDRLAEFVGRKNPAVYRKYASALGVGVVLRHQGPEIVDRFADLWEEARRGKKDPWIGWYLAFGLVLDGGEEKAFPVLQDVYLASSREPALKLLTVYLLKAIAPRKEEAAAMIKEFVPELRKRYSESGWAEAVQRKQDSVQLLIVSALLKEASVWAFRDAEV